MVEEVKPNLKLQALSELSILVILKMKRTDKCQASSTRGLRNSTVMQDTLHYCVRLNKLQEVCDLVEIERSSKVYLHHAWSPLAWIKC